MGTIFVTDRGLESGETLTINRNYFIEEKDLQNNVITNVAFAAYGVSTDRPGGYNPGKRISPVVTTQVFVEVSENLSTSNTSDIVIRAVNSIKHINRRQ